jgi:hypothetical protein
MTWKHRRVARLFGLVAAFATIIFTAHAAEVRCATDGHYSFPQDDEWYRRRWPSGVRPTKDTCDTGFIYGPIREGDYAKVLALYRRNHPFMHSFFLASSGGDVAEAIKIGRLFRKYVIAVFAPTRIKTLNVEVFVLMGREPECGIGRTCICASACALMWFGAVNRYGSVGLHRPRTDDPSFKALDPQAAAETYGRALKSIRHYLDEMEVPKPMIETMIATGSSDVKWVDDVDDNLRRPPSLAEWQDANCGTVSKKEDKLLSELHAKRSSLSPQEERVRDRIQNKKSLCPIELLSRSRDNLPSP